LWGKRTKKGMFFYDFWDISCRCGMAKIEDRVFERLRAGELPKDVRKSVTSDSRFGAGLQRYLEWAEKEVESLRNALTSLQSEQLKLNQSVQTLQEQNNNLTTTNESLTKKGSELSRRIQEQNSRLETVRSQVQQAETDLEKYQSEAKELTEKGYTEEIMSKLIKSDVASGHEMLQRVETIEKYEEDIKKLQKESEELKKKKENASKDIAELKIESESLREKINKSRKHLRKRMDEEKLFEASIKIVRSLRERYGLVDKDFENILNLTKRVGSAGMPGYTMEKVKATIDRYKTLDKLEAEISGRKETLEKVDAKLGEAEGRLSASTKAFAEESRKIEEMVKNFEKRMERIVVNVDAKLGNLDALFAASLEQPMKTAGERIDEAGLKALQSLDTVQNRGQDQIKEIVEQCQKTLDEIREERKKQTLLLEEVKNTASDIVKALNTQTEGVLTRFDTHISDAITKFTDDEISILEEYKGKVNDTLEQVKKKLEESLRNMNLSVENVKKSILDIREKAEDTGRKIGELEAYAPVQKLVMAEGEPGEALLAMDLVCNSFRAWLRRKGLDQPAILYSLDNLIKNVEELLR